MILYKTMNPYIRSRLKKTLIRCGRCDFPLMEQKGTKFWFLKKQEGKNKKISIEIPQNLPEGQITIRCDCGWGIIFSSINEIVHVSEVLTIRQKKT